MKSSKAKNPKEGSRKKKSSLESFAINQNISIDELQKKFPALYAELVKNEMSVKIDEVEVEKLSDSSRKSGIKTIDPFSNYEPTIFDFLARARTNEEGLEIVDFSTKQGQITPEIAKELKEKINTLGIRCFGPKRSANYYHRKSEEILTKKIIQKRYPSPQDDE